MSSCSQELGRSGPSLLPGHCPTLWRTGLEEGPNAGWVQPNRLRCVSVLLEVSFLSSLPYLARFMPLLTAGRSE